MSLDNCDLILTIDEVIQYFAERALEKEVVKSQAKAGTIIVMDPQTGQILAMADRPTFNPNRYSDHPLSFRRNRAITDSYEPGSTFKVIMAAGVLEEGLLRPEDRIYCEMGGISLRGFFIKDYKKYGWLTFSQVLENSSNVGAIKAGTRLGKDRYYNYIRSFGFGAKTGIELPGEAQGILRGPKDWSAISLGAISIGQEVSVTPVQLLTAFCAIANGGNLMRPYLIKSIRGPYGEILRETSPRIVRRTISPATASTLTDILEKVVEEGTGKNAALPGYTPDDPAGRARALQYDLALNGWELGGGSIRIHRRDLLERSFLLQGHSLEAMREKFGAVLDAFEYGAPPHGGIALGIDRWAALLAEQTNIREVMAFPKTQSGSDLMLEAPSAPDASQWEELGLQFVGLPVKRA